VYTKTFIRFSSSSVVVRDRVVTVLLFRECYWAQHGNITVRNLTAYTREPKSNKIFIYSFLKNYLFFLFDNPYFTFYF